MADWDSDSAALRANLTRLVGRLHEQARGRAQPTLQLPREWHRAMMRGLDVPEPAYVGNFRGDAEAAAPLAGCRAWVGPKEGVPPDRVGPELARFEQRLQAAVAALDLRVVPGAQPDADSLHAVVASTGWVHAEWVRVHPFANGNGRTARLWANFVALRYGLPPFVRLRPRPGGLLYAVASRAAMSGDPGPTIELFRVMLFEHLTA